MVSVKEMQLTMFLLSIVVDCQRLEQQLTETFLALPIFELLVISDDFEGLNVVFKFPFFLKLILDLEKDNHTCRSIVIVYLSFLCVFQLSVTFSDFSITCENITISKARSLKKGCLVVAIYVLLPDN